jgi:hypothetical protein
VGFGSHNPILTIVQQVQSANPESSFGVAKVAIIQKKKISQIWLYTKYESS